MMETGEWRRVATSTHDGEEMARRVASGEWRGLQ